MSWSPSAQAAPLYGQTIPAFLRDRTSEPIISTSSLLPITVCYKVLQLRKLSARRTFSLFRQPSAKKIKKSGNFQRRARLAVLPQVQYLPISENHDKAEKDNRRRNRV